MCENVQHIRVTWAMVLIVGLGTALSPHASAALNGPLPFSGDFPFAEGIDGDLIILSGGVEGAWNGAQGTFAFVDVEAATIAGITQVCWDLHTGIPECRDGNLEVRISPGGDFGIRLSPVGHASFAVEVEADHAMGMFVDFGEETQFSTLGFGKSFVASTVGGKVRLNPEGTIPPETIAGCLTGGDLDCRRAGKIAAGDDTTIRVFEEGSPVTPPLVGPEGLILIEGTPSVEGSLTGSGDLPLRTFVVPFESGSRLHFSPAPEEAAREGLTSDRVTQMLREIEGRGDAEPAGEQTTDFGDLEGVLQAVLNGAILGVAAEDVETSSDLFGSFLLVRFDALRVSNDEGSLDWFGQAPLQIQSGQVKGAPNLVGFGWFLMPWWAMLLWAVALGLFITRLALNAPKKNERWDRYRWVGWLVSVACLMLVFFLWDREVQAVWGTSLLSGDPASGMALLVTATIQLLPLLFIFGLVAAPIRLALKSGLILGRQGTFMGLSGGVSYILAYLLGATLLLAYIEVILQEVMSQGAG